MQRAYIGIGSNLGDRALNCKRAIEDISAFSNVTAVSSFYETEPVGNEDQPLFINSAIEIMTDITPHELLDKLSEIENKLGRMRWGQRRASHSDAGEDKISAQRRASHNDADAGGRECEARFGGINSERQEQAGSTMPEYVKWGPRTIDLDIIFYGEEIIDDPDLKIPHPEAHKRRFVLEPLVEIAPGLIHPIFKVSVTELLGNLKDSHGVVKLDYSYTPDP